MDTVFFVKVPKQQAGKMVSEVAPGEFVPIGNAAEKVVRDVAAARIAGIAPGLSKLPDPLLTPGRIVR